MDFLTFNEVQNIEYFEMNIQRLMKERMKITKRGRLNEREDLRLDQIDAELDYWDERIYAIFEAYDTFDDYEEDTQA
jgi:hypothetical protein